jgi:hypothetical protein
MGCMFVGGFTASNSFCIITGMFAGLGAVPMRLFCDIAQPARILAINIDVIIFIIEIEIVLKVQ